MDDEPQPTTGPIRATLDLTDFAGFAGLILLTVGAGLVYFPLVFLVPGVVLVSLPVLVARRRR